MVSGNCAWCLTSGWPTQEEVLDPDLVLTQPRVGSSSAWVGGGGRGWDTYTPVYSPHILLEHTLLSQEPRGSCKISWTKVTSVYKIENYFHL